MSGESRPVEAVVCVRKRPAQPNKAEHILMPKAPDHFSTSNETPTLIPKLTSSNE
jgi:hypothetical protein